MTTQGDATAVNSPITEHIKITLVPPEPHNGLERAIWSEPSPSHNHKTGQISPKDSIFGYDIPDSAKGNAPRLLPQTTDGLPCEDADLERRTFEIMFLSRRCCACGETSHNCPSYICPENFYRYLDNALADGSWFRSFTPKGTEKVLIGWLYLATDWDKFPTRQVITADTVTQSRIQFGLTLGYALHYLRCKEFICPDFGRTFKPAELECGYSWTHEDAKRMRELLLSMVKDVKFEGNRDLMAGFLEASGKVFWSYREQNWGISLSHPLISKNLLSAIAKEFGGTVIDGIPPAWELTSVEEIAKLNGVLGRLCPTFWLNLRTAVKLNLDILGRKTVKPSWDEEERYFSS